MVCHVVNREEISVTPLSVQPIVKYLSQIKVGEIFFLSIDFQFNHEDWKYEEEEYALYFVVHGNLPFLSYELIGENSLVLHRFGGTYGPAMFLVKGEVSGQALFEILAINQWGVPITTLPITIEVISHEM